MFAATSDKRVFNFRKVVEIIQCEGPISESDVQSETQNSGYSFDFKLWALDFEVLVRS
jgi:hypothetical protein